jgi:hypothetical protein
MDEDGKVYAFIGDPVSDALANLWVRYSDSEGQGLVPAVKILHATENGKTIDHAALGKAIVIKSFKRPRRLPPVDLRDHQGDLTAKAASTVDGERS